jgi:Type I phosphodiesterase / nucleotide pyrophosphatase
MCKSFLVALAAAACAAMMLSACTFIGTELRTGGEQRLAKKAPPPHKNGPHVLIFAMDGACPAQFMDAVRSGHAPHLASILGKEYKAGVFEHAYAAPHALSILPSSTIADWAAIFTGSVPGYDGIPGDEWFERNTMRFFAPVPVSVHELADNAKVVTDDLVGHQLKVKTLYERIRARSYVSLNSIHRGATIYTIVTPASMTAMVGDLIQGTLKGDNPEKSLSASIDSSSADKVVATIETSGIADVQTVYFPGIDIFTHASQHPLASQTLYLEEVTDPAVGKIIDAYRKKNVLDETYIIFISDHAHIKTLSDDQHTLGTDDKDSPRAAVARAGFRVRPAKLVTSPAEDNYQAVIAYQGLMANIYLADRSTCRGKSSKCDWSKPARLEEDVVPVLKALYSSNKSGRPVATLKGTIDLIFARLPLPPGQDALPFMVWDGEYLVSIPDYLARHPRPDLIQLPRRMDWLGVGPFGDRAGDIILLPRTCTNLPIEDRYAFAGIHHYSWHGSACEQDGHIPFILAQPDSSGRELKSLMSDFGGDSPSERELTPLVISIMSEVRR